VWQRLTPGASTADLRRKLEGRFHLVLKKRCLALATLVLVVGGGGLAPLQHVVVLVFIVLVFRVEVFKLHRIITVGFNWRGREERVRHEKIGVGRGVETIHTLEEAGRNAGVVVSHVVLVA
jgi:hypothetical protein